MCKSIEKGDTKAITSKVTTVQSHVVHVKSLYIEISFVVFCCRTWFSHLLTSCIDYIFSPTTPSSHCSLSCSLLFSKFARIGAADQVIQLFLPTVIQAIRNNDLNIQQKATIIIQHIQNNSQEKIAEAILNYLQSG